MSAFRRHLTSSYGRAAGCVLALVLAIWLSSPLLGVAILGLVAALRGFATPMPELPRGGGRKLLYVVPRPRAKVSLPGLRRARSRPHVAATRAVTVPERR